MNTAILPRKQNNRWIITFFYFLIVNIVTLRTIVAQYQPNTIVVTSQAQVDSIPIVYGSFTHLGGLIIGIATPWSTDSTDIHDLSILSNLTWVTNGVKIINNPKLRSLYGLHNIDTIGYYGLNIQNNDGLVDMQGLNSLEFIGDDMNGTGEGLTIAQNDNLKTLDGLDNFLETNLVRIEYNSKLQSIKGLKNLKRVNGTLGIVHNRLDSLELPSIKYLGDFTLIGESQMISFPPIPSLDSISGHIIIAKNEKLEEITAFNELPHKKERLLIESNPNLKTIFEFSKNATVAPVGSLGSYSFGAYYIYNNPSLEKIKFDSIQYISNLFIENNFSLELVSVNSCRKIGSGEGPNDHPYNISENEQLKSIQMNALKQVSHDLILRKNYALEALNMPQLDTVLNTVEINYGKLPDLLGLRSLAHVGVDGLDISKLDLIKDFSGMEHIKYAYRLKLRNGLALESFKGFDSLQTIGALNLLNENNASVIDEIDGFPSLDSIGYIRFDTTLFQFNLSVASFQNVTNLPLFMENATYSPTSKLSIVANTSLQGINIPALEKLDYLGIGNNPKLTEIQFPSLKTINYQSLSSSGVYIINNEMLQNVNGLRFIQSTGNVPLFSSPIRLKDNPNLSDCSAVCHWIKNGIPKNKIELEANVFPCNQIEEVEDNICDSLWSSVPILPSQKETTLVNIYPNPSAGSFYIDLGQVTYPQEVFVFNQLGQEVYRQKVYAAKQTISVFHLPKGLYFVGHKSGIYLSKLVLH